MSVLTQRLRIAGGALRGRHDAAVATAFHKPPRLASDRAAVSVFVFVLVLGATADYIAFLQAIQLVMKGTLTDKPSKVLVAGVTGVALALAHRVGTSWRDRSDGVGTGRGMIAVCALACWMSLGVATFLIRMNQPTTSTSSTAANAPVKAAGPFKAAADTASSGHASLWTTAMLFAVLYVGSGVLAIITAYHAHDAARTDYRRARSRLIKAQWRSHRNRSAHALAVGALERAVARKEHDRVRFEAQGRALEAFAEQLEQFVRQCIAARLQDPAATDGLFPPPPSTTKRPKPDPDGLQGASADPDDFEDS